MKLSLCFLRSLMPCVTAGVMALSSGGGVEPSLVPDYVPEATPIVSVYQQPVMRLTYADWRRRQLEARSSVEIGTAAQMIQKSEALASAPRFPEFHYTLKA